MKLNQQQLAQLYSQHSKYADVAIIAQYNKGKKTKDFETKRYVGVSKDIHGKFYIDLFNYELNSPGMAMEGSGKPYMLTLMTKKLFLNLSSLGLGYSLDDFDVNNPIQQFKNQNYNYYFEKLTPTITTRLLSVVELNITNDYKRRWQWTTDFNSAKIIDF